MTGERKETAPPGLHPYRDDGDETLDPPAQMHTGETKEKDPGSRPESQRVASCANRLVVTPGAYREDADETLDPGSAPYREDGVRSIQG